ncbi:MAG: hypothetical protein L6U99_12105 [Clostridium sp.]|nr:MAG: hypothetical protein L6U99_12105 [Clostridium sp.]
MIYTLTLAPSLDYVMECDSIKIGQINRSKKMKNIIRVVKELMFQLS